jgi:hypothetical protein
MTYYADFVRDPIEGLLRFGSVPQRARAPWFTNTNAIDQALRLPDQIVGPQAVKLDPTSEHMSLEAAAQEFRLLGGLSPHFHATDESFWHVHVDLALHKARHGDAAGFAMGRIGQSYVEHAQDPLQQYYERVVRTFDVPLAAQIVAPPGDQIYISSITRFILQLKQLRGFNITSFSFDQFQSADAAQQLMLAGLVTAGMDVDKETGDVTGLPKPFSVDGRNVAPYREVLEAANEGRIAAPKYYPLRDQFRKLELVEPGYAPDHQIGGQKDVADAVAGVVGYLSVHGHSALIRAGSGPVLDRKDLEDAYDIPAPTSFGVDGDASDWSFDDQQLSLTSE